MRGALILFLFALGADAATARGGDLDVPIYIEAGDGQAADCHTSTVSGLRATGDGFLSVRSGPGESYRELARLHNGEVVTVYGGQGKWVGVVYRTDNPECLSFVRHKITSARKGWVSSKYLMPLAG